MFQPHRDDLATVLKHGAIAGLIGGVVLLGAIFAFSGGAYVSAWLGPQGAGAWLRHGGREDGGRVLGLLSHFLVAVPWGMIFGLVARGFKRDNAIAAGALFGLVVWITMYWVVLPLLGLSKLMIGQAPAGISILEHVLFGLTMGVVFARVELGPFFRRASA